VKKRRDGGNGGERERDAGETGGKEGAGGLSSDGEAGYEDEACHEGSESSGVEGESGERGQRTVQ
jgi:hypothetical protein